MTFTDAVANERVAYRLNFPDFGMASGGLLPLTAAGQAMRVTWTNEGRMGADPIHRWFGLFMDRLVGPDFEAELARRWP